MLTNIYRIGGLHQVSWFQLVPDVERISLTVSMNDKGCQDEETVAIMMAHVRLQDEGHLSAWTVPVVKEGALTAEEKVKLWIFFPGLQDGINTAVLPLIIGLKVVGAGHWYSPGDNEEVGAAFCEALRNRLERALRGFAYVRFGDVFVKCRRHGALESRKSLPTCELVFMGSEEALFVYVVVRRKRVRLLATTDMQYVLAQQYKNDLLTNKGLSVVVAPYGVCGRLTGCSPGDLVGQIHRSKLQAFSASSLPFRVVSLSMNGGGAVQSCYAEVRLGEMQGGAEQTGYGSNITHGTNSQHNLDSTLDQARVIDNEAQAQATDSEKVDGKVLIYPLEAVLAPVLPPIPARTYLRRCWLQEWAGTHWLEDSAIPDLNWLKITTGAAMNTCKVPARGENGTRLQNSSTSSSSSGSGGSSIKSSSSRGSSSSTSGSSASGESEVGTAELEFEADADSLSSKVTGLVGGSSSKRSTGTNLRNSSQNADTAFGNSGSKRNRGKGTGISEEPPSKLVKMSTSPSLEMSALLEGVGNVGMKKLSAADLHLPGALSIGAGTQRDAGAQIGTAWDWTDDGMGLGLGMGMDMQADADILAEFGDFGDFFEDDGLHFGEPPGTAESQALMFADYVDGVTTPGTGSMDGPDPMLLPILDFPTLESIGKPLGAISREHSAKAIKFNGNEFAQLQSSGPFSPLVGSTIVTVDPLSKAEAMILFAPGYERVELPSAKEDIGFSSTYVPESRKMFQTPTVKDVYVYNATPPVRASLEIVDSKLEKVVENQDIFEDSKVGVNASGDNTKKQALNVHVTTLDSIDCDSIVASNLRDAPLQKHVDKGMGSNGPLLRESHMFLKGQDAWVSSFCSLLKLDRRIFPQSKSGSPVLATELDCALLQVSMLCAKDGLSSSSLNRSVISSNSILPVGALKEETPQSQVDQAGRAASKPPQAQKKKALPSRIAGDADEDVQDGLRSAGAQVGVWRPVQAPKPPKIGTPLADFRVGLTSASSDGGNFGLDGDMMTGSLKAIQLSSVIDAIPLLAQQAAVASDIALDGEYGDGPLGWLAFQERQRYQSACGPGSSHIGCGGMFSIRHSIDNAGVEYIDPLAAEVSPATVANLLQSDFRIAIAAAFGESNTDGPLTSPDWCRSRFQGDNNGSVAADSKDVSSTITSALGEPMGPSQGVSSNAGGLKTVNMGLEDLDQRRGVRSTETGSLSDQPRGDEGVTNESDLQTSSGIYGATMVAIPVPALLVGYQDDWLKTSPTILHFWEKAPLEPYAPPKPVSYYVLCLGLDSLLSAASDFFQQLSSVYESCRLGTHVPGITGGLPGVNSGTSKPSAPGFMIVDGPPQPVQLGSTIGLMEEFIAGMENGWSFEDYRRALLRVCRSVPVTANAINVQRDPEQSQCTVVYIICPSSEPADLLQIIFDASQCFGTILSEKDRRPVTYSQPVGTAIEEANISPVLGFSTPRLVLQILPAETIMKASGTVASQSDLLKEIAFCVYSKARRIQRKTLVPDTTHSTLSSSRVRTGIIQSGSTMPGMWKDCSTVRSSGITMALDPGSHRSPWDGSWQTSTSRFGDSSLADGGALVGELHNSHETARFLYEPLFILAEPGLPDSNANYQTTRSLGKDLLRPSSSEEATGSLSGLTPGLAETSSNIVVDGSDTEISGVGHQQPADLHCCYTWTDDWQWLVSVWTDARGELLDIEVLPLVGAQKDSGLQAFFSQILQQGLQLLSMAVEAGSQHPRNIIISCIGGFTERESQEWYRTIMTMGGDDSRKWPLQLWPAAPSGTPAMQDMGLLSDRSLGLASSSSRPPSPSPSTFSSRNKSSGMPLNLPRRQGQGLAGNQLLAESKGPFQWVNSISLVSVRMEHCLQTVCMPEMTPSSGNTTSTNVTGVSTVRTLANMGASYMLVPTNSLRPLSLQALQFPLLHSATASPISQLLQGSLIAQPLASAFIISPPTPSPMSEFVQQAVKDEWPSTLSVGLIALLGNFLSADPGSATSKSPKDINKESFLEAHGTVQFVAAQLHALSWLTVNPAILLRHSPLPFHCNIAQRLRRLLSYLDVTLGYPRLPHTPM